MSAHARTAETKVQETADDAAVSKLSAIRLGYVVDPFMGAFVRKQARRSPLINRGYFSRMSSLEVIIKRFLAVCKRTGDGSSQIVCLGAGLDTTFFRLWNDGSTSPVGAPTAYFEVDFPEITARKLQVIRKHSVLLEAVAGHPLRAGDVEALERECAAPAASAAATLPAIPAGVTLTTGALGGGEIHGPVYHLLTADLRDVSSLQSALTAAGIQPSRPTLLLSECVLVYLEPEESCAIIAWAARAFSRSVFVTYEQIRPHDAFGQVMARNLEERGYSLRGLAAFPDMPAQTARYRELGYATCTVCDMNDVYYRLLPRAEVARVERLELFDEVEEWHLMSAHYCVAVAVNEVPHVPQRGAAAPRVTDMPAPAPKAPRTTSASAAMSPKELAAAVVHAHEEGVAVAGRSGASLRSLSPSTSPRPHASGTRIGMRSRSRSTTGGESDMEIVASAVSIAAGTTVESMDMSPSPIPTTTGGVASASVPGAPDAGGLARTSSNTSMTGGLVGTIRTHAGDIVLGGAHVDFEAIAEAEEEMTHARHVREAMGIDVIRDTATAGAAASARATGAPTQPAGLRSPASALHAAAVENSKASMITTAASAAVYDAGAVLSSERATHLLDVLFPLDAWKKASASVPRTAPGSARRE